jgi:hypothetical protein
MDSGVRNALITGIYVFLSAVGLLVALLVALRLLRALARLLIGNRAVFGEDTRTWLISLGVALLVFPAVLPAFAGALITFIYRYFVSAPEWLFNNWGQRMPQCYGDFAILSDCVGLVSFGFLQAWALALGDAYSAAGLSALPYHKLLLLATWALVAQLLAQVQVQRESEATPGRQRWLHLALGRVPAATRQNLFFFLILAVAGYLSVTSIAAIPGLQEAPSDMAEVSVEKLRQQLDDSLQAAESDAGAQLEVNPFDKLDKFLQANSAEGNTDFQSVESFLTYQKTARQDLLGAYTSLLDNTQLQKNEARSAAITVYEISSVGRKGRRERVEHFLDIAAWFRGRVSQLDGQLVACQSEIDRMNVYWQVWSDSVESQLSSGDSQLDQSFYDELTLNAYASALQACRPATVPDSGPPARPALGSYLGPFGLAVGWLLRTESLSLALIVGLLGFGLLGSAISSLVREQAQPRRGGPLVEDLSRMVIRGMSAAVVVFLAVEGGLAIFASGSGEPNPYVLLFTCLVASVFSEDVWQWAHERLSENLGEPDGDAEEPPPPAAPEQGQEPGETERGESAASEPAPEDEADAGMG